jgi:protein TonB
MATHELRLLLPEGRINAGPAFLGAGLVYLVAGLLLALMIWLRPPTPFQTPAADETTRFPLIIFKNVVGPMGGGGGGGNRAPAREPLRTAPTPAVTPPEPLPQPQPTVEPAPEPEPPPIAATVSAVANDLPIAVVSPNSTPGTALGAGPRGAGGPGDGGVGPGTDRGLGPGDGPNTGGGPYGPGDVDVQVVPTYTPKPAYTPEGMQHRRQGAVELSCIVLATGRVGTCRITRSLDGNALGLDDEALKAAGRFIFRPAMRKGQPVPVEVNIIIEFRIQ